MRGLAIGIAIAVIVFVVSGGHFFFLPLLFLPFGLFSFGHRRQRRERLPEPTRRSRWL
jgi:hypothetical protein